MAIKYARTEYIKRSKGQNACYRSAYNANIKIKDQRTNQTFDFRKNKTNVFHEILLPAYVNNKFKNAESFSNLVEKSEKRKNSQLFKEFIIALPNDVGITLNDHIALCYKFIEVREYVKENLGVQIDIHYPKESDNLYAKILITTRRFNKNGESLADKARDLDPIVKTGKSRFVAGGKELAGETWGKVQTAYFEENALNITVKEISDTPEAHIGLRKYGELAEFNREIKARRQHGN